MRVKTPKVISRPQTSSIRPAHQAGHAPTSIGIGDGDRPIEQLLCAVQCEQQAEDNAKDAQNR